MSVFSPETFLDAQITEVSVKRPPLTAGLDIVGVIKDVASRAWTGKKDPSQSGIAVDVKIEFDLSSHPAEAARIGTNTVIIQDSIMLNLNEGGMIDMTPGKNARLRQYREALNMNNAGEAFSFRAMPGRLIRCKIKHEPYEGDIFDKIDSVARA